MKENVRLWVYSVAATLVALALGLLLATIWFHLR